MSVSLEPFDEARHSVEVITELLHKAYARLQAMGFNYTATNQDASVTLKRLKAGMAFVALDQQEIVGTITYYEAPYSSVGTWYQRQDVGIFGQFAVKPECQGQGIGSRLLETVEALARSRGKTELALDTSEGATHLRQFYERHGYRDVEFLQWPGKTYRSVVMTKRLAESSGKKNQE